MFKLAIFITAAFILSITTAGKATATDIVYQPDTFNILQSYFFAEEGNLSFNADNGAAFSLFGHDIKSGIFQLYVQPTTGIDTNYGISATDLNNIAPAAGIQFKIDLGL